MRSLPAVFSSAHSIRSTSCGGDALAAADEAHPHAFVVELRRLAGDPLAEHPHQPLDLLRGPGPVLGREGEDGQLLDPQLDRVAQPRLDHVGAGPVPLDHRQPALLRPAAVAVGDDRYVSGAVTLRPPQTSRISSSLPLSRESISAIASSVCFCSAASARRSSSSPASPSFFSSRRSLHDVAADVADRDPALLGDAVDDLDHLPAPLLGQLRDRQPDHVAVVARRQADVGLLDRFLDRRPARPCRRG